MMPQLVKHDLKMFSFNKETKTLTSEASTLAYGTGRFMAPLFPNDPTPERTLGFVVKSHVTGEEVYFMIQPVELPPETEQMVWTFAPTLASLMRTPRAAGMIVNVYNT